LTVTVNHQAFGEVPSMKDLSKIFRAIREEVDVADSRPTLTELYRRAGDLVSLTHTPSWEQQVGERAEELRRIGEEEFRLTAKQINRKASELGTMPNYDEVWHEARDGHSVKS
jgi:hypothetical protein